MIEFKLIRTSHRYPFNISHIKGKNYYILKEYDNLDYRIFKSLTNNIEEVLEYCASSLGTILYKYRFFQYGEDGLFEVTFNIERSSSSQRVYNVQWKFVSKSLKYFEVLYGQIN